MAVKNKGFAFVLILALILIFGVISGAALNARRGEVESLRDIAQTENSNLQASLSEAQGRLKDLSESIPEDQSDETARKFNQINAQKGYCESEVSLLQESLDRTRGETEKLNSTIEAIRETLTERDNMVSSLQKELQALADELNALSEGDEEAPAKEPASETGQPTSGIVVAQVGNREIIYAQLVESYEQYVPQYEDKYDLSDSSTVRMLMLDELNYLIELAIVTEWAQELNISESIESFYESAESFYNSLLENKTESFLDDDAKDGEEAREKAVAYLEKHHYTTEYIAQIMLNEELNKRVKAYYASLATPTDEELYEEYDRLVAEAKARYEQSPEEFEYDIINTDPVYYYPSGYRVVRQILILFGAEEQLEVGQLLKERAELEPDDARISEIEARINGIRSSYDSRISDIEDEYANSASFEDLIERLGEDAGMKEGLTSERGYYVSAESTLFDENFKDAAMAIENVGEVSPPIISGYGIHIIRYERGAEEGSADFDLVKDQLTESYVAQRKEEEYEKAYDEWTNSHPVVKYQDRVIAALAK